MTRHFGTSPIGCTDQQQQQWTRRILLGINLFLISRFIVRRKYLLMKSRAEQEVEADGDWLEDGHCERPEVVPLSANRSPRDLYYMLFVVGILRGGVSENNFKYTDQTADWISGNVELKMGQRAAAATALSWKLKSRSIIGQLNRISIGMQWPMHGFDWKCTCWWGGR